MIRLERVKTDLLVYVLTPEAKFQGDTVFDEVLDTISVDDYGLFAPDEANRDPVE